MSVGARRLRDDVYGLCISHVSPTEKRIFIDHVGDRYNRIHWEKAILYHHQERIFDGISRRTSNKFKEKMKDSGDNPPNWKRGTKIIKAPRRKDIDWFGLAVFDDVEFWREMIDSPREKLHVYPSSVDQLEPNFTNMYELISDWLLTDFNFTTLYNIFEFARDDNISFISDCIAKVEDPRKRSTSYLSAVIKQERAVLQHEIDEDTAITDHSKQVMSTIISMCEHKEDVDWDKIEGEAIVGEINREEFKKVKTS